MRKKFKLRVVDMCIYIDKHIQDENRDDALIFEYIQDIFYALSMKKRFFSSEKDYQNYSLYAATRLYMLVLGKAKFKEGELNYTPKIKSILNYIKAVLYPFKVDWQKENFCELNDPETFQSQLKATEDYLGKKIPTGTEGILQSEVEEYISSLPRIIKDVINQTPYKNKKIINHNLYISCLLSFLNLITLNNHNYNKLKDKQGYIKTNSEELIQDMLNEEKSDCVILWHLDNAFSNYVFVLVNRIKNRVISEIKEVLQYYEPSDEIIKDILMSPISQMSEVEEDD